MKIDEVNAIASPMIRKYDWYTSQVAHDNVRLTVTDGLHKASVDITTGENIKAEIKRLIEAVDNQEYTVLS